MLRGPTAGPLRVHAKNPRYFADATGRAVLLTGSHTWAALQDYGRSDPPPRFDYDGLLEALHAHGHTFLRMWCWEQARWAAHTTDDFRFAPNVYERTGPGLALDERPRFDLSRLNDEYFERIRERVRAAGERGIYVAIMLFQGWSVEFKDWGYAPGKKPWLSHPFNAANNINGVDGDPDETGDGLRVHTLTLPEINELQRTYVRRVVDTVRDLDNVLFEITNESAATIASRDWQYAMVEEIQRQRTRGGYAHPVLMTAMWPSGPDVNAWLLEGPAEAISPSNLKRYVGIGDDYMFDPPPADGRKVIIVDTDHVWGIGGDQTWVWRAFTRGLNPIFMDPWEGDFVVHPPYGPEARAAMGLARRLSDELDLAALVPSGQLVSSGFALADEGRTVIVAFLPDEAKLGVDLRGLDRRFTCEWRHVSMDSTTRHPFVTGGTVVQLASPYLGGSVLILKVNQDG